MLMNAREPTCIDRCILLLAKAASIPVTVVPMLEPRVSGYIRSRVITLRPTSGVSADVNTELDCTRIVRQAPTIIAI